MKRKDDAFYQLYEQEVLPHLEEIYRSARALLGGGRTDEAEDLTQEVFAHAWRSIDRYQAGSNGRAWLYAILMNKVRHVYRSRSNARVIPFSSHSDGEAIAESIPADPPTPTEVRDEDVLAALARLSSDHRELVLLVDTRNFTYREAAEMLELPIGTVMSRLSRARDQLRHDLARCAAALGIDTSRGGREK